MFHTVRFRALEIGLFIGSLLVFLHLDAAWSEDQKPSKALAALLGKDPMEVLKECSARAQKMSQFTQMFTKQERIGGKLRETETMFLKYRAEPFSIYVKWMEEPHKGREVIYVEGRDENKAVLHEYVGPLNVNLKVDPNGTEARKRTLRPVTDAGIRNATKSLLNVSERARQRGDMRLVTVGAEKLDGRDVLVLCRFLEKRDDYFVYATVIYIDPEQMLPIKVIGYDWNHQLSWIYTSSDVKSDVKLTDKDFDPQNPDYDYPGLVGLQLPKISWPFGKKNE